MAREFVREIRITNENGTKITKRFHNTFKEALDKCFTKEKYSINYTSLEAEFFEINENKIKRVRIYKK